mmetsp:Transcript_44012/g.42601  ORF Transcript_44012/g.42601 Transcript_44012/m.42601 type:complete len:85 (-) Transcript_44012:2730-2984(-)
MSTIIKSKEEKKEEEALKVSTYVPPQFDEGEDPVNILGVGMLSYFKLIQGMVFVSFWLTIFAIYPMYVYSSYSGFSKGTFLKPA